jgi:hypothetical protein
LAITGGRETHAFHKFGSSKAASVKLQGSQSILQINNNAVNLIAPAQEAMQWTQINIGTSTEFAQMQLVALNQMQNALAVLETSAPQNTQVYIDSSETQVLFTNASVNACYVYIYDFAYKRDVGAFAGSYLTDMITDNKGTIVNVNAIPATPAIIGFHPYDSTAFKNTIKITKTTKFWLAGGESHLHRISAVYRKVLSPGRANAETNAIVYKGFSHGCLIANHGSIVIGGGTGGSGVNTAAAGIRVQYFIRHKFRPAAVSLSKPHVDVLQAIPITTGTGTEFVNTVAEQVFLGGTGFLNTVSA